MDSINTLRSLLVGAAIFAAFLAAVFGRWGVVAVLAVGVAAHAGLWVYLRRLQRGPAAPHTPETGTTG